MLMLVCFSSLYQDGSGRQCLLIDRVTKSDSGWYTLSAINEAGMSTCNARLDVGSKCVHLSMQMFLKDSHQSHLLHEIRCTLP